MGYGGVSDNADCDVCAANTLSLFDPRLIQTSMVSFTELKVAPTNSDLKSTTIDFNLAQVSTPSYYDFSETWLNMEFTVTKPDGSSATASGAVPGAFVNLPTSSFFSEARLNIHDKTCEATGGMYHYQSMIHDLLVHGKEYKKEVLALQGYFDECAEKWHGAADDDYPGTTHNRGYGQKRTDLSTGNMFRGTINLGMFRQEKKLPAFLKIQLVLTRAPPEFILDNASNDAGAKLVVDIKKLFLTTRLVEVVPSVFNAHIQSLKQDNFKYHINREVTVSKTLAPAVGSHIWGNVFSSTAQLPKIIVFTMVRSDAKNGSYVHDPFRFQHFNLNYAQLKINAKPYPYNDPLSQDGHGDLNYFESIKP